MSTGAPAGWPRELPPPGSPEFGARVTGWLFDLCPPRYRDHEVLRRQPQVLAWLAVRHVTAQRQAVADAMANARADLAGGIDARALDSVVGALEAESAALLGDLRGARLVAQAVSGTRFVPRL